MLTTLKPSRPGTIACAALSLLLACLFTGCTPAGPRALLDGERLLQQGRYADAIRRLRKAVELLPQNPQAWNHLGLAYHRSRKPAEAAEAYQRAIGFNPNLAVAWFNLGYLWLEQGDGARAADAFVNYVALEPRSLDGWRALGQAQLRAGDWRSARQSFNTVLRLDPDDPVALNGLGIASHQLGESRRAWDCFNDALRRAPRFAPAWLNLGVVAHQAGGREQAIRAYRQFASLRPEAARVIGLDDALQNLQSPPPAPPARRTAATQPPAETASPQGATRGSESSTRRPQGESLASGSRSVTTASTPSGVATRTEEASASSLPLTPTNIQIASSDPDPASRTTPASRVPASPDSFADEIQAASRPVRSNATPPAPQPDRRLINEPESAPEPAEPAEGGRRFVIEPRQSQTTAPPPVVPTNVVTTPAATFPAPATTLRAPTTDLARPTAPTTQRVVSQIPSPREIPATREEQPPPLVRPVTAQRELERRSFWNRANPANWLGREESPPRAPGADTGRVADTSSPSAAGGAPLLTGPTIRIVRPTNAPAVMARPADQVRRYRYLRPAAPGQGDVAAARPYLTKAVEEHRRGRLDAAVSLYQRAIQLDPASLAAHLNLAAACLDQGDLPKALAAGEMALVLDPESRDARLNFALTLDRAGFHADAADEAERVITASPNDVAAHLLLGNLYAQDLARPDRARRHYLKVLELAPNHPQAAAIRRWLESNGNVR